MQPVTILTCIRNFLGAPMQQVVARPPCGSGPRASPGAS